jgi:hypothetical protein
MRVTKSELRNKQAAQVMPVEGSQYHAEITIADIVTEDSNISKMPVYYGKARVDYQVKDRYEQRTKNETKEDVRRQLLFQLPNIQVTNDWAFLDTDIDHHSFGYLARRDGLVLTARIRGHKDAPNAPGICLAAIRGFDDTVYECFRPGRCNNTSQYRWVGNNWTNIGSLAEHWIVAYAWGLQYDLHWETYETRGIELCHRNAVKIYKDNIEQSKIECNNSIDNIYWDFAAFNGVCRDLEAKIRNRFALREERVNIPMDRETFYVYVGILESINTWELHQERELPSALKLYLNMHQEIPEIIKIMLEKLPWMPKNILAGKKIIR